jgi:DNA-binding FrmR family transcriptional regulator
VAHRAHHQKLLDRIRIRRGQAGAIERGSEAADDCAKILRLIAASGGAINALRGKVLEGHVREHAVDPARKRTAERSKGVQHLIDGRYSCLT